MTWTIPSRPLTVTERRAIESAVNGLQHRLDAAGETERFLREKIARLEDELSAGAEVAREAESEATWHREVSS